MMARFQKSRLSQGALGLVGLLWSCSYTEPPLWSDNNDTPPLSADRTLDVASWNLDWFGDRDHGPRDESRQLDRVSSVIASTDADVWGLVEVVAPEHWSALASQLEGYAGVLASDAQVTDGERYYDAGEQKVGLMYKTSVASLKDARLILTEDAADFAGRPPLQVTLQIHLGTATRDAVFVVIHAKCCSDAASWQRRVNAANALKAYLDHALPAAEVWIIGDFNDDVDTSIAKGYPSPYAPFINDWAHYAVPTQVLSEAGVTSMVGQSEMVDHHLITQAVHSMFIPNSAAVLRVDREIEDYGSTTSDHYPVLSRYEWDQ